MQVRMVQEVAFVFCIVMVIGVASLLIMFVYCHLMTCEKNFHFIFSFILLPTHIPACQNTVSPPFFLSSFFSFLSVPFLPCPSKSLPLRSLLVTCECPFCVTFFLCPDVFLPLLSSGGDWWALSLLQSFSVPLLAHPQLVPLTQLHSFYVLPCPSGLHLVSAFHSATFYCVLTWPFLCSPQKVSAPYTTFLSVSSPASPPAVPQFVFLAQWLSFCVPTTPSVCNLQRVSDLHSVTFFLCPDKLLRLQSPPHAPHSFAAHWVSTPPLAAVSWFHICPCLWVASSSLTSPETVTETASVHLLASHGTSFDFHKWPFQHLSIVLLHLIPSLPYTSCQAITSLVCRQ